MKLQYALTLVGSAALLAACGGTAQDPEAEGTASAAAPVETAETEPVLQAQSAPTADDVTTKDGAVLASFTGDATEGEKVFLQCKSCHAREEGVNRIGPHLAGVIGRNAGSVEGYNYSQANTSSGIVFSEEKIFQYLEDPQRVIPGTKMAFAGLRDAQDRADVIAYLKTPSE